MPITLQDHGIENGARLTVRVQREIRTREEVEALVDEIMASNPRVPGLHMGANRTWLLRYAKFDDDGLLQDW